MLLVWVCLPMAGRIGRGEEKMQLALGEGTAHGTASHRNSRLGPFNNAQWVLQALLQLAQTRGAEPGQGFAGISKPVVCLC